MGRRWVPKAKSTTGFTKMIELTTPITEEQVRDLKVGDQVSISGVVYTGRDAVHKYLHEGGALPEGVSFEGSIIYHCGPVVVKDENGDWQVTAAGPTTSIREEPYQADIMKQFGVRGVIGKGGMGPKTLAGCAENGGVYLHGIGGAAQVLAEHITKVRNVYFKEEFGSPEAIWELEVTGFPAVVTMDSHNKSLHAEVAAASQAVLDENL